MKSLFASILYATYAGLHVCTLKDAHKCNCWFHTGHLDHASFLFNPLKQSCDISVQMCVCVCVFAWIHACVSILCALICILYISVGVSLCVFVCCCFVPHASLQIHISLGKWGSRRRCCTCSGFLRGPSLHPAARTPRRPRPNAGWRCWRRSRNSGLRPERWRLLSPVRAHVHSRSEQNDTRATAGLKPITSDETLDITNLTDTWVDW